MEISVRKSFVYRRISWKLSIFILYSWEKFFCPFPVLVKLLPPGSKSINSHYRYRNFLDRRLSWGRDRLVYSANFHAKSSNKRFYNPEHIRKERSKFRSLWACGVSVMFLINGGFLKYLYIWSLIFFVKKAREVYRWLVRCNNEFYLLTRRDFCRTQSLVRFINIFPPRTPSALLGRVVSLSRSSPRNSHDNSHQLLIDP